MSIKEIELELEDVRMEGDLYSIARFVMVYQLNGHDEYDLLPEERERLLPSLEEVRRNGHTFLKQGYMIARWHMLLRHFGVHAELEERDRRLIQLAVEEYIIEGNFETLAGLLMTCDYLGFSPPYVLTGPQLAQAYKVAQSMR